MTALRACCLQVPHGDAFEANLAAASDAVARARAEGARLVVLPEYWFAAREGPAAEARHAPDIRRAMEAWSRGGLAVCGNLLERRDGALLNLGVAYEDGRLAHEQPKVHPMPREAAEGVAGGARLRVGHVAGQPTGMLVCADILYPEAARVLALQGALLLVNPVMSPWRETDNTRSARDAIFIARAYDSGAFVLKAGGFLPPARMPDGTTFGIAGRSLVAAPWGLVARARDDFQPELLLADLDLDRLHEFRKHQATFPARRPEAYEGLL